VKGNFSTIRKIQKALSTPAYFTEDDAGEIGVRLKNEDAMTPLILRNQSGGAPFSFMPANSVLRCCSNEADR
jgi:hypothetical protein